MWIIIYNDVEKMAKQGKAWVDDYIVTDQFETPKLFENGDEADACELPIGG